MERENTGYKDITKSPRERAQALLEELSLDEKMAQLTCISHFGDNHISTSIYITIQI